ncbi:MAG: choice-of-anchor Q domain-containing protein [Anaerolineales bacterium]
MRPARRILFFVLLLALAAWACTLEDLLEAADFPDLIVTKTQDTNDGECSESDCSLREAVLAANAQEGENVIFIPDGSYVLTLTDPNEDAAGSGDLDLLDDVIIAGASTDGTIVDGNAADRVFHVLAGAIELRSLTVRNGVESEGGGINIAAGSSALLLDVDVIENLAIVLPGGATGGGIYNEGMLEIEDGRVDQNISEISTGGIFNMGTLTLRNTTVQGNTAQITGGIANMDGAVLIVIDSTISANYSEGGGEFLPGDGGGIYADGQAQISGSIIRDNIAEGYGGGLVVVGEVEITDSNIHDNLALSGGGITVVSLASLTLTDVTISENQAIAGSGGGLQVGDTATATLSNVSVLDNFASQYGGGLVVTGDSLLTIATSTLQGNQAQFNGGGLYSGDGDLILMESIVEGNTAVGDGGGAYVTGNAQIETSTFANNTAGNEGGGIRAFGAMTLIQSTLSNNEAVYGGGLYAAGSLSLSQSTLNGNIASQHGGGLYVASNDAELLNCTLSANTAAGGGGVFVSGGGTVRLDYCTLAGNVADPGASLFASNASVQLFASILDGNPIGFGSNCALPGSVVNGAGNLDSEGSCGLSDSLIADPLLGPLSSNGGLTQTHALLAGSPAFEAASASCPPEDQRGVSRPQGSSCDIGAFEAEVSALVTSSVTLRATANENVNCRSGPGSVYEALDIFLLGSSAPIEGRDAGNNWVRILLPNDIHCWVWVEVITIVGDLSGVPVLPAPPTPTLSPTPSFTPEPGDDEPEPEPEPSDTPVPWTDTPIP